ncbi:DUF58 domain-containing protein [Jonesia quinghaiensis]|uniref:DUF58 domain-containing protein n=1 Tax=Jonesia quinghaiensis TaxID=262806 RepID=UPI000423F0B8|nr:DUF58 domain-containing protein [Jonesia quinghaiensis]
MALSWRPAAFFAAGLIPALIFGEWHVVIAWGVLTVLLIVGDALRAASPRSLEITRSMPFQVRLGEVARGEFVVRNTGRRRAKGLLHDVWPPSAGVSVPMHRLAIRAGDAIRLPSVLRPTRRGDRVAAHVTVRLFGPLGFAARQLTLQAPSTIKVLPEFRSARHLPSRVTLLREIEGGSAVQVRGQGTEFDSLRPYVEGDDVRSIDWRATARSREVTVRTWRPERDRRVVIVVDTSRTSAPRVAGETRLDAYLEAAMLLGALAAQAGDRVELIAFDRAQRAHVSAPAGGGVLHEMAVALAGVSPVLVEADWTAITTKIHSRVWQRSLIVVLTNSDLTVPETGFLSAMGALSQRHSVIVAGVEDPETVSISKNIDDSAAVFDAAAATASLLARRAATSVLERSQVVVVDSLPDDLAPRVADTYLMLKAAGRL